MSRRGERGKGGRGRELTGTSRKKEGEEERRQGYSGGRRGEREGRDTVVVGEEREKGGV